MEHKLSDHNYSNTIIPVQIIMIDVNFY